jgi:hypothetical protein
VARIRSFDPMMLGSGEAAAEAGAMLAADELACGLGEAPALHAAAAPSASAMMAAIRACRVDFGVVQPRAIVISPEADTWPFVP